MRAGTAIVTNATLTGTGLSASPLGVTLPVPVPLNPGDNNRILTASGGGVSWAVAPSGLPPHGGVANGQVLTIVTGAPAWATGTPGPAGPAGPAGAAGAAGGFHSVQGINAQSVSYTLVLADAGRLIQCTNTTAVTITVPTNAAAAFPVGQHIDLVRYGTGGVNIAPATGVVLRAPHGLGLRVQFSCATLVKMATEEWLLVGDMA
ncbi:MAG: hypothetical protein DDT38_01634 [Firmicutes bacterium]|nr:hypothetical protein [candidate division NPL-UPA2 bacterium]